MLKLPFKLKISEVLLFFSGMGLLVSAPFFEGGQGPALWFLAKGVYFLGLIYFFKDFFINKKTK